MSGDAVRQISCCGGFPQHLEPGVIDRQTRPRQPYDVLPVGIAVLDANLCYIYCNPALAKLNGIPAEEHIGRSIADIVPSVAAEVERPFRQVLQTGVPIHGLKLVGDTLRLAEVPRTWLENVEPLIDEAGRVTHLVVTVEDVTALQEAVTDLEQVEATLHASQELNPDGFAILRAMRDDTGVVVDFTWEYANPTAQSFVSKVPLVGQQFTRIVPLALQDTLESMRKALQRRKAVEFTGASTFKGLKVWHKTKVLPVDQERIAISYHDITQEKQAEEQMSLVLSEYRHRIKNMLTVVNALAGLIARTAPDAASMNRSLQGQLVALAIAQDKVGLLPSEAVNLRELAVAVLKPFNVANLFIDGGPDIAVPSDAAVPLSLLLNELATNALKHGSLADHGSACLKWSAQGDRLSMAWQETGPSQSQVEPTQGQGSKLFEVIQQMLPNACLEGKLAPEGLRVKLEFDLIPDQPEG